MKKRHALLIALAVAAAAVFGLVAATRTVHLGSSSSRAGSVSKAQIAARNRQLDKTEIALRKALSQKPPKLPALPAAPARAQSPAVAAVTPAAAPAPRAQRVIYVRPAPIVRHVARSGEHEVEHESGHGAEYRAAGESQGGGGFDD